MKKKDVLTVKNLSKIYSKNNSEPVNALNNLNLDVKQGEIFGLLGPNGAGKSTFINILGGLVNKDSGNVKICGLNIDENIKLSKFKIGIVPQELNIDPFFSPAELLELQAGLYGVPKRKRKTDEILENLKLSDQRNAYARTLSGGMRRRLLIGKALVHDPEMIILDEPTAGVDVELRNNLWDNVKELNKEGVTIILTTHYLIEAQQMCDRIAIIDKGNLVALDTTENLLKRIKTKKINLKVKNISLNENLLMKDINFKINSKNSIAITYEKNSLDFGEIVNYLNQNNIEIEDISTEDGDLEDVFVQLTKH